MTTNLTPPPPAVPTPPAPGPARSSARVVAIVAIALGGAVALGAVGSAIASAAWAGPAPERLTADPAGVERLVADVDAGALLITYADVDEARLDIDGDARGWRVTSDGSTLTVAHHRPWWAGWRFFDFDFDRDRVVLTLPEALEDAGLDARFDVSGGSVTASGEFGELAVDVSAGSAEVTDSRAEELLVDVSAGRASLQLADVRTADLHLSAGEIEATLSGSAPDDVAIDVSAGSVRATLPDELYSVQSDVSAGRLDAGDLRTGPGAAHRVTVDLSAGSVELRAGR